MTREADMTYKELLELAAKAAVIEVEFEHVGVAFGYCLKDGPAWDPLYDDGDALRLEVALKLSAVWDEGLNNWNIFHPDDLYRLHFLARHTDRKRATTMAAAAIGRTM